MAENQKRIDEKLVADFGGFNNFVKNSTIVTTKRPVIIPIITKGVIIIFNKINLATETTLLFVALRADFALNKAVNTIRAE